MSQDTCFSIKRLLTITCALGKYQTAAHSHVRVVVQASVPCGYHKLAYHTATTS